ncbi:hypothetical protein cypCar_00022804 [Cyprinus carpio]|nr:hypothetical protein cypCar_00022804 [Cyprinus carpio]
MKLRSVWRPTCLWKERKTWENRRRKANTRMLRNNAKLKETKDVNEEFRDQGITRPKVLILVPFRDGVLRVVQTFITLLEPKGKIMDVSNKKRFKEEYGEEPGESPPRLHRPDDYHAVFSGKHVLKHLNLQLLDSHGVDFSRVRIWNLNNWAAHYRKTLVFSAIQEPQITNILTKHCHNYRGQVCSKTIPKVGSICQVLVQLLHVFQMFQSDSFMDQDARSCPSTESYSSYFDFVRLQNYLKKENISFASVSECSQRSEVSRARHFFQKGEKQFMLFSERFLQEAGVREGGGSVSYTCTALYSRYDMHRLAAIIGAARAAQMLQSKKTVHLFITGGEKHIKIECDIFNLSDKVFHFN